MIEQLRVRQGYTERGRKRRLLALNRPERGDTICTKDKGTTGNPTGETDVHVHAHTHTHTHRHTHINVSLWEGREGAITGNRVPRNFRSTDSGSPLR